MKKQRQRFLGILSLIFLFCFMLGGGLVAAAPLWGYPNDKVLISEVHPHGLPGSGSGTEWIEIFNPTLNGLSYNRIGFNGSSGFWAEVPTPMPPWPANNYPDLGSGCFLYMARDAGAFYTTYNQCPNFASQLDGVNCPDTVRMTWSESSEIGNTDETLCMFFGHINGPNMGFDSVAWGTSAQPAHPCIATPAFPLPNGLPEGQTYLRGADAPESIGPGAEGLEIGGPHTEELGQVWRMSGSVNVSWEGPEAGVCRAPTAVTLAANPTVRAMQHNGYALAFFGLLGLLTIGTAYLFVRLQAAEGAQAEQQP